MGRVVAFWLAFCGTFVNWAVVSLAGSVPSGKWGSVDHDEAPVAMADLLRGQGPRVFISHGFGNSLARDVAEKLQDHGFQAVLPDDTMLVGQTSLRSGLDDLVRDTEIFVPVLDTKANQSDWVRSEIALAIQQGHPIIPIVQDAETLVDEVTDIPYLDEVGEQLSDENVSTLVEKINSRYAYLSLDQQLLFQTDESDTLNSLRSTESVIRVIVDPENVTGGIQDRISDAVEAATQSQPEVRNAIEQQTSRAITNCIRSLDLVQPVLREYRSALLEALDSYGADVFDRSLTGWQRLFRLLAGESWTIFGRTLPPASFPVLWCGSGEDLLREGNTVDQFEGDNSVGNCSWIPWALQYHSPRLAVTPPVPAKGEWFRLGVVTSTGARHRAYVPGCARFSDGAKGRDKPVFYLEQYEWADLILPQIVVNALRHGDSDYEDFPWRLEDCVSSFDGND